MQSKNPAFWENGQYLEEWDPVNNKRHSDAARKAQAAKLQRLMRNRPPRDVLPRRELADRRTEPPLHFYGFPFTTQYAVEYARRHRLTIGLSRNDSEIYGKSVFDFGDLDDSQMDDPELNDFITLAARRLMFKDLSKRCGISLLSGHPFSLEWDGIVALWSNYNVEERYAMFDNYEEIVDILRSAMNEGDGPERKLQWWFDWDNNVGVFTSVD